MMRNSMDATAGLCFAMRMGATTLSCVMCMSCDVHHQPMLQCGRVTCFLQGSDPAMMKMIAEILFPQLKPISIWSYAQNFYCTASKSFHFFIEPNVRFILH
jgi:hypothetical protein